MPTAPDAELKCGFNRNIHTFKSVMSTKKLPVKPDSDTEEAPAGEGVNRWPESNPSGSPSSDSVCRSSSPFRPKGPTCTSAVGGRATQADDRFVSITSKKWQRGLVDDNCWKSAVGASRTRSASGARHG